MLPLYISSITFQLTQDWIFVIMLVSSPTKSKTAMKEESSSKMSFLDNKYSKWLLIIVFPSSTILKPRTTSFCFGPSWWILDHPIYIRMLKWNTNLYLLISSSLQAEKTLINLMFFTRMEFSQEQDALASSFKNQTKSSFSEAFITD